MGELHVSSRTNVSTKSTVKGRNGGRMKIPTGDQCSNKEKVYETDNQVGYACWYPQMGGYTGKAVAVFDKSWTQYKSGSSMGGCVDVSVWHDGELPFDDRSPTELHHCSGEQFIEFGKFIEGINNKNMVEKDRP